MFSFPYNPWICPNLSTRCYLLPKACRITYVSLCSQFDEWRSAVEVKAASKAAQESAHVSGSGPHLGSLSWAPDWLQRPQENGLYFTLAHPAVLDAQRNPVRKLEPAGGCAAGSFSRASVDSHTSISSLLPSSSQGLSKSEIVDSRYSQVPPRFMLVSSVVKVKVKVNSHSSPHTSPSPFPGGVSSEADNHQSRSSLVRTRRHFHVRIRHLASHPSPPPMSHTRVFVASAATWQ